MKEEVRINEVDVRKLSLKKGDVLVVNISVKNLCYEKSKKKMEKYTKIFKEVFPENKIILTADHQTKEEIELKILEKN